VHRERGSVLLLFPAAVLIVVVLAALTVDRAVAFGAQRDLVATAQAAAADAVAAGVDLDRLRIDGAVRLDPARVEAAVALATATADGTVRHEWEVRGSLLVVRLERRVRLVFAGGVPGGSRTELVTATASAELRRR
jgi:hypothetical protein